jgi:Mycothiol maleylpyruvate isomerase N-terminal domain
MAPGTREQAGKGAPMTGIREAYLQAAASAAALLSDQAVAAAWGSSSALPEFSVAGLAGHLARQVVAVPRVLGGPVPAGPPATLLEHYARVLWIGASLDHEANAEIRRDGEDEAADGAAALAARIGVAVDALRTALPAEAADRLVHPSWVSWSLTLDDFLITRMMEIAVHSDDLAVSVGIATPPLPPAVLDPVLTLLTGLAVRRHGATALLRALSRSERAPATIAAF